MIENNMLRVGGNTLKVWFGKWLNKWANKLATLGEQIAISGKYRYISNPTAKLYNPFTLVISFTMDNVEKYQILLQGDYKQQYKECEDGMIKLTENELFMIINQNKQLWYKKE